MKTLILLILMALASPAFANYAFVQQTTGSGTTMSCTLTPAAVGDLIVVIAANLDAGTTRYATAISDTAGDTFTSAFGAINNVSMIFVTTSSNQGFWVVYTTASSTSANTITPTLNGGGGADDTMICAEYSGIATTSPFIVGAHAEQTNTGTGTDAVTTGNINVTSQPAVMIGYMVNTSSGAAGMSAGTGFTSRAANFLGWNNILEDKRITATGNVAATATDSAGATSDTMSIGVAFAEASSGPTQKGGMFFAANRRRVPFKMSGALVCMADRRNEPRSFAPRHPM